MNRKWPIVLILFILLASGSLPAANVPAAYAAGTEMKISASTVNIRSGPGLSYSVTGSLSKGETVNVVSQSDEWYEVNIDGETGWIASWLTTSAKSDSGSSASGETAVSTVDRLNVRAQPDLSSSVLTQMNAGEQATIIQQAGDWVEIDFHNTRGFVAKQYISVSESSVSSPSPEAAAVSSFEIAVDALNVRTKPDLNSDVKDLVRKGKVFPIKSMEGNWVEIELSAGESGWVYAFHGHLSDKSASTVSGTDTEVVTVLTDGTNLRSKPSTSSEVVSRTNAGERLSVIGQDGDWYQVSLPGGQDAFIATWVVTTGENETVQQEKKEKPDRKAGTLEGLTIVIDPGHGGNDGGTVGARDTEEKDLTLKTAETLTHHLRSAGAEVVLTRQSDVYVDLRKRVSTGHQVAADAFISLHYDATNDSSVSGFTTYYLHDYQEPLAEYINAGLGKKVELRDRGVQPGNYLVLRENRQPAVLVELGFLSNFNDERIVSTSKFRDQAALGLYNGIIHYFDAQLEK
ncbi:SH3 domain-containing protein [Planococcus ruber]|uniref:SH3 domain-containing protein n=1 Tax=Planococcus ruber TaxID=2027871 RepID=UPI001FEFBF55|nr:SH3 domain-containing protein [Planococcus ruber]MCJ1908724.1 SH3 domain-containing protein [Planococcus ruber]